MKAIKMSGSVMVPRCRRSLSTLPSTLQELPLDPAYLRRYRDYHSYDLLWSPRPVSRPNRRKRVQAQEVEEPRETKRSLSPPRGTPSHSRRHASTTAAVPLHSSTIIETRPQKRDLALLFPGAGSQYVGMGAFLLKHYKAARETWEEAEEILGGFDRWRKSLDLLSAPELSQLELADWEPWQKDRAPDQLRKIVFGGAPQSLLTKSSNAQPAILITSLAFLRVVEKELKIPLASQYASVFLGHSSGEFAACAAAGAMSFEDALRISRLSGMLTSRTLMTSKMESCSSDAPPEIRSQMTALLINPGHSHQEVTEIVQQVWEAHKGEGEGRVEIAAYNSSSQIVLSGSQAGVDRAADELYARDIARKATDLPVWVPFHSSFMRPAEAGVRLAIDRGIKLNKPSQHIVSCLTGELLDSPEEIASALVAQMSRPVQWTQALHALRTRYHISEYLFMGPGKVLANLAKKEVERGCWDGPDQRTEWTVGSVTSEQDLRQLGSLLR